MANNIDCKLIDASLKNVCENIKSRLAESEDQIEDIQTQIWILSGVAGGVALILIIVAIALAIQLSSLRQKVFNAIGNSNPNPKPKPTSERDTATRSIQNPAAGVNRQLPAHSFVQPPRNNVTSEEELAQLGFSAYTGHPIDTSRGMPTSPGSAAGGVRVLPRNPPTGFRQNQNGAYNNGYM